MVFSPQVPERGSFDVVTYVSSIRVPAEPRRWGKPLRGCGVFFFLLNGGGGQIWLFKQCVFFVWWKESWNTLLLQTNSPVGAVFVRRHSILKAFNPHPTKCSLD